MQVFNAKQEITGYVSFIIFVYRPDIVATIAIYCLGLSINIYIYILGHYVFFSVLDERAA